MFFGSVTRYPRLTIEINLAENLVDHPGHFVVPS